MHGKVYVVIAYNGTLSFTIGEKDSIIEELEPGLYIAAVYTGGQGEVTLHLEASNLASVSIFVKTSLPADLSGDSVVDYRDLAILAARYGEHAQ